MKRVIVTIVLLTGFGSVPAPAHAWNATGHMVVAYLAYQGLEPGARQKIAQLLRQHPNYERDLLQGMPKNFPDPDLYAFMIAATWPDIIRDTAHPLHAQEHHSTWHYINLPYFPPEERKNPTVKPPPLPEETILVALRLCVEELKATKAQPPQQAVKLCWLLHLGGDLHQPLHAATLFSKDYPEGDRGGNLCLVRGAAGRINLHKLWDDILGGSPTPHAVAFLADTIQATPRYQRSALGETVKRSDFETWAKESLADAEAFAYLGGYLRGVNANTFATSQGKDEQIPFLPTSYEAVAKEVAHKRVALAGYRLADLLNKLYGSN
jgi:hypothetical protein